MAGLFDYQFQTDHIAIFATLILLEGILSFDNAAVLAAMARRLPKEQQRKALLYGLVGAYTFRFAAIFGASLLIENLWLRILGGAYLVYLTVSHFIKHATSGHEKQVTATFFGLSAFWSTVVLIEVADIVFALDQIVAAVALTKEVPVIIAAAFIAILALRLSATYMIRLMNWFPQLEHLAYLAVGWVGVKLLLEDATTYMVQFGYLEHALHIEKWVAISVTMTILVVPVLLKLLSDMGRKRRRPTPAPAPDVHPPVG